MRITACSVPARGCSFGCAKPEQHSALKRPTNTNIRRMEFSCRAIRVQFGTGCQCLTEGAKKQAKGRFSAALGRITLEPRLRRHNGDPRERAFSLNGTGVDFVAGGYVQGLQIGS